MLEDRIDKEFREAIKHRLSAKVSILRLLKSDMHNYMIEKRLKELKDEDVYEVLKRQIKRHKDSIEQFKKGEREDLVRKEEKELAILNEYMPEPLSEKELKTIINGIIQELQVTGKKDFGKVMKSVIEKTKGRAEGKTISKLVNELLASE